MQAVHLWIPVVRSDPDAGYSDLHFDLFARKCGPEAAVGSWKWWASNMAAGYLCLPEPSGGYQSNSMVERLPKSLLPKPFVQLLPELNAIGCLLGATLLT